jgi:hypothetical protein
MLREDVMRAARAAVWARAVGAWDRVITPKWREDILHDLAAFLAHLRAGAVEVHGYVPDRKVHPWDCFFDHQSEMSSHVNCRTFSVYPDYSKMPKTAVDAALVELRSRARAAGAIVQRVGLITRPAPPDAVRMARFVIQMVRARLSDLSPIMGSSDDAHVLANAATLAAIEVGNWVAEVELHTNAPYDISGLKVWIYSGRADIDVGGKAIVWVSAARAPRALRPTFAAAYMRWYGRLLERRLEVIGV